MMKGMLNMSKNFAFKGFSRSLFRSSTMGFCHHDNSHKSNNSGTILRKPAPAFKAMAWQKDNFVSLSLDKYRGKWVVLFFYPLDFTFVCPTEIVDFNQAAPEFHKLSKILFLI